MPNTKRGDWINGGSGSKVPSPGPGTKAPGFGGKAPNPRPSNPTPLPKTPPPGSGPKMPISPGPRLKNPTTSKKGW